MSSVEIAVDKVLKSRWTLITTVASVLWLLVTQVILPINNLQIQNNQILTEISKANKNAEAQDARISALEKQVIENTVKLNQLSK